MTTTVTETPASASKVNRGDRNMNPPGIGLLALWAEDLRTHGSIWDQGFWAVSLHRFGNWRMGLPRIIRFPFSFAYRCLFKWVEWTCGISLTYTTLVGRRVHIWHFGTILINCHRIGDDVQIRQNTTIGVVRTDRVQELPTIEDRVDIGCGVAILGGVTVGHDSMIGANAVVVKSLPPGSVAVGVPAKIIKNILAVPKASSTAPQTASTQITESASTSACTPPLAASPLPPAATPDSLAAQTGDGASA